MRGKIERFGNVRVEREHARRFAGNFFKHRRALAAHLQHGFGADFPFRSIVGNRAHCRERRKFERSRRNGFRSRKRVRAAEHERSRAGFFKIAAAGNRSVVAQSNVCRRRADFHRRGFRRERDVPAQADDVRNVLALPAANGFGRGFDDVGHFKRAVVDRDVRRHQRVIGKAKSCAVVDGYAAGAFEHGIRPVAGIGVGSVRRVRALQNERSRADFEAAGVFGRSREFPRRGRIRRVVDDFQRTGGSPPPISRPSFRFRIVGIRFGVPVEESALKRSRARERENRLGGSARRVIEFEISEFCAGIRVVDLIPSERLPVQIEQTAADAERERVPAADLPVAHENDFRNARAEPNRFCRVAALAVEPHFAEVKRVQIFIKPLNAAADIERDFMISRALDDEIALADFAPFRSRGAGKIRCQRRAGIDEKSRAVEIRRSLDIGAKQKISRVHGDGSRAEIDILRKADFLRSRAAVVPNDPARSGERVPVGDSVKIPNFVPARKCALAPRNDGARFFERNVVAVEIRHLALPRRGIDAHPHV